MKRYDQEALMKMLWDMPREQVREWAVKVLMSRDGVTFQDLAKGNKITFQGIACAVNGSMPWSPKIVRILEKRFKMSFRAFLTEKELRKIKGNL